MTSLVFCSSNEGKIREVRELVLPMGLKLLTKHDTQVPDPEETGSTCEENAIIKARAGAVATGILCLADDSGVEVDCLGGRPGVHSARYAGEHATDAERVAKLLKETAGARANGPVTARFVCVIAVAKPGGEVQTARGVCEGTLADAPRGVMGFGYDPIFVPTGYAQTYAELPAHIKNVISHRGQALRQLPSLLRNF